MLSIEEYIRQRKKEDQLNEYDRNARMDNMRTCVNYVFEYFNQYLDISKLDEKTVLNNERLEKYRNKLRFYEPEIQDWLVNIYKDHDKQLSQSIVSLIKKEELFLIYNTDQEFRSLSYDCYAELIKKNPFLKNDTEMLFLFIKDHHRRVSNPEEDFPIISEEINEWMETTWSKYHVNLYAFSSNWINRFYDNPALWDIKHKIKSKEEFLDYEYDYKQKNNLFNINSLYHFPTEDSHFNRVKGFAQR